MAISSKQWLAVLLNENGASYYIDQFGDLKLQLAPKPLNNMFEGWSDIVLNYGRSAKYFGLERTYTSTYKFVKDGAKILRALLYANRSVESGVYLGLLKLNRETNGNYELYYKAEIDLSKAVDDPKTGITVEVMQDGPAKFIRANDGVTYDIPCEGITLDLDGIRFTDTFNYFSAGTGQIDPLKKYIVPVNFVNNEGENVGVTRGDSFFEEITGAISTSLTNSGNFFFSSIETLTARVTGDFTVRIDNLPGGTNLTYDLSFYVYPILPPALAKTTILSGTLTGPGTYTISLVDEPVVVTRDGKLFIVIETGSFLGSIFLFVEETNFKITFDSRFQITECAAKRPIDVFKELVANMTDNRFTGVSSLLEDNEHLVTTCGDAIRGLDNPVIKTSFSDFFTSYGKILKGAVGVNYDTQEVLFEERSYFLNNNIEILDIGEVAELTIDVASDLLFNSVKVGYPDQKQEEGAARQEVNAGQEYRTPISRTNNQLDLVGRYRTDIFGIERIRQRFFDLPNTDARGDNSVFIININRAPDEDGKYSVFRPTYTAISGGTNIDTWYNLEQLTPKTVLIANGDLLSGGLYALPNELVKFTSADKNATLIRTLNGVTTVENGNLRVNQLTETYFRPFLLKFRSEIPQNIVSLLQQAGRGYITGTWQGKRFYGFPQEVSVKPAFNESQEMTLLCSSLTDVSEFINYNDQALVIEDMGIISHRLPVKFIRVGATYPLQYHFKQMDTDWFTNRIGRYSVQTPYFQKWQTNDTFDVQFITEGLAATLVIIDCNGAEVDTITLNEIANDGLSAGQQLYVGTVDCSVLAAGETYYLLATFGSGPTARQFVTEPILIAADWPETVVIDYSNDENDTDIIWNVAGGYTSRIRVEGYIQRFRPGGRLSQYEDEPLDIVNLDSEPTRSYEFLVGSDQGLPDWMIDKINRALTCDNVSIDGYEYTLDKDAQLEEISTPGSPLSFWTVPIREANNRAGIAIDAEGENEGDLFVTYNINTKGFSSNQAPANQQDAIVQVTDIE